RQTRTHRQRRSRGRFFASPLILSGFRGGILASFSASHRRRTTATEQPPFRCNQEARAPLLRARRAIRGRRAPSRESGQQPELEAAHPLISIRQVASQLYGGLLDLAPQPAPIHLRRSQTSRPQQPGRDGGTRELFAPYHRPSAGRPAFSHTTYRGGSRSTF